MRFDDLAGIALPGRRAGRLAYDTSLDHGTARSAPGGPLVVDLRRDGPHALIAGTTGSGKSELLQTLVASLALGNRPTQLSFVLVDYKGGSAFKDAARLPHCVGSSPTSTSISSHARSSR